MTFKEQKRKRGTVRVNHNIRHQVQFQKITQSLAFKHLTPLTATPSAAVYTLISYHFSIHREILLSTSGRRRKASQARTSFISLPNLFGHVTPALCHHATTKNFLLWCDSEVAPWFLAHLHLCTSTRDLNCDQQSGCWLTAKLPCWRGSASSKKMIM